MSCAAPSSAASTWCSAATFPAPWRPTRWGSCASCSTCRAISTAPWNAASRPCWAAARRCGPACRCSTPRRLIETATITAARVLGLGDRIGSLTPGKRADIVLVRKGPFGDSVVDDACAHVLLQTSPRDIDTVLVDGKVRMKAGVLQGFDARAGGGDDGRLAQAHPGLTMAYALSPVRQDRRRQVDAGPPARRAPGDAAHQ